MRIALQHCVLDKISAAVRSNHVYSSNILTSCFQLLDYFVSQAIARRLPEVVLLLHERPSVAPHQLCSPLLHMYHQSHFLRQLTSLLHPQPLVLALLAPLQSPRVHLLRLTFQLSLRPLSHQTPEISLFKRATLVSLIPAVGAPLPADATQVTLQGGVQREEIFWSTHSEVRHTLDFVPSFGSLDVSGTAIYATGQAGQFLATIDGQSAVRVDGTKATAIASDNQCAVLWSAFNLVDSSHTLRIALPTDVSSGFSLDHFM